jgi:hypothetical protein
MKSPPRQGAPFSNGSHLASHSLSALASGSADPYSSTTTFASTSSSFTPRAPAAGERGMSPAAAAVARRLKSHLRRRDDAATQFERVAVNFRQANAAAAAAALAAARKIEEEADGEGKHSAAGPERHTARRRWLRLKLSLRIGGTFRFARALAELEAFLNAQTDELLMDQLHPNGHAGASAAAADEFADEHARAETEVRSARDAAAAAALAAQAAVPIDCKPASVFRFLPSRVRPRWWTTVTGASASGDADADAGGDADASASASASGDASNTGDSANSVSGADTGAGADAGAAIAERADDDCAHLGQLLAALAFDCFKTFSDAQMTSVARRVRYARIAPLTVVCAAGDAAHTAYFVLGGSASVLIRPPGAPFDICVKRFGAGFSFGEPALLSADARRSATVRADGPAVTAAVGGTGGGTGTGSGGGSGTGTESGTGTAASSTGSHANASGGLLEVLILTRAAYEAVCREDSDSGSQGNGSGSGTVHDEFEAEARAAADKMRRAAALALAAIPVDTKPHRFQPSRHAPRWRKIVGIQCVVLLLLFFVADAKYCHFAVCDFSNVC